MNTDLKRSINWKIYILLYFWFHEIYANNDLQELEVALFYFEDEQLYYIAKNKSLYDFLEKIKRKEYLTNAALDMLNMFQKDLLKGDLKTNITLYARTIIPKGISTRNQQIYKFFFENNYLFLEHHFTVVKKIADDKIELSKKNLKERSLFITDSKLSKFNQSENKLEKLLIDIEKEYDIALNNFSDEEIKNYCINLLDFFKL